MAAPMATSAPGAESHSGSLPSSSGPAESWSSPQIERLANQVLNDDYQPAPRKRKEARRSQKADQGLHRASSPNFEPADESRETLFTRFLIAPLSFFTFLLSLALIDRRNRAYRSSLHGPTSTLSKIPIIGRLADSWWPAEPYSRERKRHVVEVEREKNPASGERDEKKDVWTWTTNHRRMMRLEVSEAFDLRKEVVVAVLVAVVFALVGLVVVTKKFCEYLVQLAGWV
ncbi:MAG: hypothetical protein M4579_006661 [Chaenotheca gracillima]|nr:MAG: hypothetical protein M4579_006661 [Chaenotheca gracillima]